MKKTISACAALLLLAGAGATAQAGDQKSYVGIDVGYANEIIQNRETLTKFTPGVYVDFDDTVAFQARYGRVMDNFTTFELMVDYAKFSENSDTTAGVEDDFETLTFLFNSKLRVCPRFDKFYFIAGLGVMNVYEDITAGGATSTTSEWGIASRIGVGVEWPVNDAWSVALEGARTSGIGGIAKARYNSVSLGVRYHF